MNDEKAGPFTLARLPRFAGMDYASFPQRLRSLLDSHRGRIDSLTADPDAATWHRVAAPMEALADELQRFFSPIAHFHNVVDDEVMREPYKACVSLISEYTSELAQHALLFRCYERIQANPDFEAFDLAQKKVITNALRDFHLGGVALPAEQQDRVTALKVDLAQLGTHFAENVLDATQSFKLNIDDEDRLGGLPESVVALARQNAERDDAPGWTLTLDLPCYVPAITRLDDRELRHTLYKAYSTRASAEGPDAGRFDNTAIMASILSKRQELAHILGFDNYAAYSLATKMASSTNAVLEFLGELVEKASPNAEREFDELGEFARQRFGIEKLQAWDMGYCAEKLKQDRFDLSQEDLKPYFPLSHVIDGMFAVVAQLFDIGFDAIDDVETWHPDVRFFAIRDTDGLPLGYFYLDLYAREKKRPGAWMDECLVRWHDGSNAQLPVAFLNCNFTPPVANRPSLLTHDDVITLFHEFGHGLHHMLTRIDRLAVAGINGVPWDAVELPSQFLENWCWEREALDIISRHHETGASLPDELYERLNASKRFHAAMQLVRQLEFALFDFQLHIEFEPGTDIQSLIERVRQRVAVVEPPSYNRFQHSFSHIFAGGYAAGYYSYKWAEVLSADAFSLFEEEGIFNREMGKRFRSIILENGGAEDAMTLFERFRGRKSRVAPLLRQAGLNA